MTVWAPEFWSAYSYGWAPVYWLRIAGMPVVWTERALGKTLPTGFTSESATLVIEEAGELGVESIDRDRGIGVSSGCAFKLLDSSTLAGLLTAPTLQTRLTAALTVSATTITVLSTTGWPSSGELWIGTERITYSGTTGTTFTGCTRGTCGSMAAAYATGGVEQVVTDKPVYWRGLDVTLWATMADPSGFVCGADLVSDEAVEVWCGRLVAAPRRRPEGWEFAADGLDRVLDRELSQTLRGEVTDVNAWGTVAPTSTVNLVATAYESDLTTVAWSHTLSLTPWSGYSDAEAVHRDDLHASLNAALAAALTAASATGDLELAATAADTPGPGGMPLYYGVRAKVLANATVRRATFLVVVDGQSLGYAVHDFADFAVDLTVWTTWVWYGTPLAPVKAGGSGIPLVWLDQVPLQSLTVTVTDGPAADVPAAGRVKVTAGSMIATYAFAASAVTGADAVLSGLTVEPGSSPVLLGQLTANTTAEILLVDEGTVRQVALRCLQSSGTGLRGDWDTLPQQQGYGLSEDRMDLDSFDLLDGAPLAKINLRVSADGASASRLFGEAMALGEYALVLRPDLGTANAPLRLTVVPTGPGATDIVTITDADLLYGDGRAVEQVDRAEPINVLVVESQPAGQEEARTITIGYAASIAANGRTEVAYRVDGTDRAELQNVVMAVGSGRFRDSELQQACKLRVHPDVRAEVGDVVRLELTDRQLYDWRTGTVGYTGLGRVLGKTRNPGSGAVSLTVTYGGLRVESVAPSMQALDYAGSAGSPTTIDVAGKYLDHLLRASVDGAFELVHYVPGEAEDASERYEVSDVELFTSGGTDYARLSVTISAGSPVLESYSHLTLPPAADASDFQQQYTHTGDGAIWS